MHWQQVTRGNESGDCVTCLPGQIFRSCNLCNSWLILFLQVYNFILHPSETFIPFLLLSAVAVGPFDTEFIEAVLQCAECQAEQLG